MTLTSTTNRSTHTGNNSTTAFSYSFKIFDQSEIDVYLDGVEKTITTHYTVSGVGSDSGGNVTFTSGNTPGTGVAIVFVRNIAKTQTTDYTVTGQINPQTIEDALDKLTMQSQKNQLNVDESFGFADSVTDVGTVRISADASDRASKVLAFDSSGGLSADQEIGTSKGNWAASTAYVVRDIIKDTSNNNIYICLTAHTSSGSQPISSNADSAKWRLLVDAASATTSQTAAAASATAAASSATAAASSASAASTSATNAASSATTASTQASNSASSATSSASSATSSSTSSTTSSNYATKVDGAVTGTDFSAKAWAVGGTGVTDTASRGAAKEWATAAEDDQVDGSEYSAKHYAAKASASAATVPTPATIKDGTYWGYTTAGSANTYTLTTSPTISSYATDMFYHIKMNASNTGASTINVDSVGAKNIKKYGGAGMVDLVANDLESGGFYTIIYDGTQFLIMGGSGSSDSQVDINTADIFMINSRRLSDHSANVLNVVDGFVDDFQDGSTANNTAIDISGSTNISHDNTSKYWENTQGAAAKTVTATGTAKIKTSDSTAASATESYTFSGSGTTDIRGSGGSDQAYGQEFKAQSTNAITQGTFKLKKSGSPSDNYYYDIFASTTPTSAGGLPTGSALATTAAQSCSALPTSLAEQTHAFSSPYTPTLNNYYHMIVRRTGSNDGSNCPNINTGSNGYALGNAVRQDSGSWSTQSIDTYFKVWQAGSTISPKFGTGMMQVGTGGDNYISTADHNDWNCSSNFAIDFWMNHKTLVSSGNIVLQFEDSSNYNHFSLSGTTDVEWKVRTGGTNHWAQASSSLGLSAGTWYHVALVRSGSNIYAYVAGNQVFTSAVSNGDPANIAGTLKIGGDISAAAGGEMDGWIDEFRWSNSDRGWTGSTITVPSSAHTNDANTKLLLHMDGSDDATTFTDSSAQDNLQGTLKTRAFGGTNMPPVPASSPSNIVVEVIDKQNTGTPTYKISRNGGSNFQTISSWDIEDTLADGTTVRLADVTMTATAGTSPLLQIEQSGTGQDYRLYSLGLKYK